MDAPLLLPVALGVVLGWGLIGLAGLLAPQSTRWVAHGVFPLGALGSAVLAGVGLLALFAPASSLTLPIGLPGLPMHLRLDALSGFFLFLLGASSIGISVFAAGYFRSGEGTAPGLLGLQYHIFLAAMAMVLLAADAYAFMLAWEVMALSSYFLVVSQHRLPEIRSAGFVYLLLAHLGAIALLLCFGVMMQGGGSGLTFEAMRQAHLSPAWATVAFGLAVAGFGAKAGLVPLHIWLPEAHPAAPSPVSALMSGVMLKTALYGLLRVSFDLLHAPLWWWGVPLLALGLFGALFGALFAAVQTDMKRLLAYSSIENIGIAFAALGLALVFHGIGMPALAALALAAMLYHVLNHAFFKSLLFLATGSVLHATHQRSLGRLGGLLRRMPWVGWSALVGALAMAGLPLLGGFVAEWLLLQAFVLTPALPQALLGMFIVLGAALLVLVAALAAYVMVKFYGVVFLGREREPGLAAAHDPGWAQRAGLVWLAGLSLGLGLFPGLVLRLVERVELPLLGQGVALGSGWSQLAPVSAQRATFDPLSLVLLGLLLTAAGVLVAHAWRSAPTRVVPAWACGELPGSPRMQDSAEGFGQPVRRLFAPLFEIHAQAPAPDDAQPRHVEQVDDPLRARLYRPVAAGVLGLARLLGRAQQVGMAGYLMYTFGTLLVLLLLVLR